MRFLRARIVLVVLFAAIAGCADGKLKNCDLVCGGPERLELAQHECERIETNERDVETCKLVAAVLYKACLQSCK